MSTGWIGNGDIGCQNSRSEASKDEVVIVGDWSEEEIQLLFSTYPQKIRKAPPKKKHTKKELIIPECALIQIQGFPQVAVSQRFSFPQLDSTQLQYLSIILGYGTRSRLMEEMRETRGLVYSLGAQVQGKDIIIRYSPFKSLNEGQR